MSIKKYLASLTCLLACLGLLLPAAFAQEQSRADNVKAMTTIKEIRLKHWLSSPHNEKMAFLIGFTTMIEVEREWQGKDVLPIEKSTVGAWVKGLTGVKLIDICKALDDYALKNPDEGEKNILLVISELYVQPKLTDAEIAASRKHYEQAVKPQQSAVKR